MDAYGESGMMEGGAYKNKYAHVAPGVQLPTLKKAARGLAAFAARVKASSTGAHGRAIRGARVSAPLKSRQSFYDAPIAFRGRYPDSVSEALQVLQSSSSHAPAALPKPKREKKEKKTRNWGPKAQTRHAFMRAISQAGVRIPKDISRLAKIAHQMHSEHGASVRDAVTEVLERYAEGDY